MVHRRVRLKLCEQVLASECPILSKAILPAAANHPSNLRARGFCTRAGDRGERLLAESLGKIDFRNSEAAGEIDERAVEGVANPTSQRE